MNFKDAIHTSLGMSDFLVERYLGDITDQEMLARPAPDANHIAWQLGHLIQSEWHLVDAAVPGSMPALPAGFKERHTKDTAASEKPGDFLTKDEYLRIAKEVRAGTLKVLDSLSDADFDSPISGRVPPFVKKVGEAFVLIGPHWSSHAGQWVVVRRKLGRPRMF
jgi:hypothetical protein